MENLLPPLTLDELNALVERREFDQYGFIYEPTRRMDVRDPDPFTNIDDKMLDLVNFSRDYVSAFTQIRKMSSNSYGLKHDVEHLLQSTYCFNGVMCLAIASLGIPYSAIDSPNIGVGISVPEHNWVTYRTRYTPYPGLRLRKPLNWDEFANRHEVTI